MQGGGGSQSYQRVDWLFGYKLHMISSTDPSSTIVPLSADVTKANISDKPVYPDVVASIYLQKY
jgi:hypothetical protein